MVFIGAFVAVMVYSWVRFGIVPKAKHLRRPGDTLYAASWNFLSEEKWTPEGIALHKQVIKFGVTIAIGLGALWLVLDALT